MLSTQVLSEFYLVVTRKLAQPLAEADAADAVAGLALLPTVPADAGLVRAAIATARASRLSLWDGLIVAAAAAGGCQRIVTEDLGDGAVIDSIRIENPFRSNAR